MAELGASASCNFCPPQISIDGVIGTGRVSFSSIGSADCGVVPAAAPSSPLDLICESNRPKAGRAGGRTWKDGRMDASPTGVFCIGWHSGSTVPILSDCIRTTYSLRPSVRPLLQSSFHAIKLLPSFPGRMRRALVALARVLLESAPRAEPTKKLVTSALKPRVILLLLLLLGRWLSSRSSVARLGMAGPHHVRGGRPLRLAGQPAILQPGRSL